MTARAPTVRIEISFGTNPLDPPVWTDVSAYVRAFSIRRGRQRELDRIEAGTATVILGNRDRRFDPTNESGPYFPNVVPMRRIRIGATWNSATYWLFSGFIESWTQKWPEFGDATVEVHAVDAFKALKSFWIENVSVPQELSGSRVHRILDLVGWPADERMVDIGQSQIQEGEIADKTALQHLHEVAETENGLIFIAGDGKFVFRNRHTRILPSTEPIFGDGPGELPYDELSVEYTEDQVWNFAVVTRKNGIVPGVAQEPESQIKYMMRVLKKEDLLQTSDEECQAAAEYLVFRYAYPQLVFRSMTVVPHMDEALWAETLSRELWTRILVRRRPPGGGSAIERSCIVEGIKWDVRENIWKATWDLSQKDVNAVWILAGSENDEYAPFSKLEDTTRLAY